MAYLAMIIDKFKSKNKSDRISENTLLLLALSMGSLGIFFGMLAPVNHKRAKWKFRILVPVFLVVNIVFIYFMESKIFGI